MPASDHLGRQFASPGDDDAKKALIKQLKPDFPKEARAWLKDPAVTVDAPSHFSGEEVDWSEYPEWRASRQLKPVVKIAKKLDHGKDAKPSVMVLKPGADKRVILDGHHHALARQDHKEEQYAFTVHVPSATGPWDTMHDKQLRDAKKDDFGKTPRHDRDG